MLTQRLGAIIGALILLAPSAWAGEPQVVAAVKEPAATLPMPDQYRLDVLIRTTVIALNQANQTGNYTVFRDLTAPSFQALNSTGQLSDNFIALRKRSLDMSAIIFFPPRLVRQPAVDNGVLRLTGYFPTQPEQLNFDMMFQEVNGAWRLFGISLNTTPAQAPVAAMGPAAGGPAAPAPASGAAPAKASQANAAPAPKPAAASKPGKTDR